MKDGAAGQQGGLDRLFYPRAVAVVGSMAEGKLGYELVRQIVAGGYREVFAVNPRGTGMSFAAGGGMEREVTGHVSVAGIGRAVDLAVIASPAATVAGVLEDCGQAGVGAAVIITAGFAEAGNRAGEEEIKHVAAGYGMQIVGPNCAGMLCAGSRLYATLETRPPAGAAALVSQSGALAGAVLSWAQEQGLGFSKFVSYGNRAGVDETDLLRYLALDADTQVVALYIESVADGRQFMAAVDECARRKPVVVIKAGRTASGGRATLSHTGSLAGADAVYEAALRQCGAIRVKTVEELFDVCKAFVSLPPARGRRVAIVTNSGGPGVLAADMAEELGLAVAEPSAGLRDRLARILPAHCGLKNPIDLTVEGTEAGYRETLLAALEEYDAAVAVNVATPYLDSLALARGVCTAAQRSGKPVLASFMAGPIVAESIRYLTEHGVPNFPIGERAVRALATAVEGRVRAERQDSVTEAHTRRGSEHPLSFILDPSSASQPEAMAWLRENGIAVPEWRVVTDEAQASAAGQELGYPVVMKVLSPDIVHKSDCGGVVLSITGDGGARAAFRAVREAALSRNARFCGALLCPMLYPLHEGLVGLSYDAQFGPVVALGMGGIYAEILGDVALRVAPVGQTGAEAMIGELRAADLLRGARGRPASDLGALADLLVKVSELPFRYPEIGEMDLNPVFLFERGAVVGDVRIVARA